ncbi:MAG: CsiV family protein [Woeseia sp.]
MSKSTLFIFNATILAFAAVPALAQQDTGQLPGDEKEQAVEPIRRYTVELIIFAYGEGATAGNELWLPDEEATETGPVGTADSYFDTDRFENPDETLAEIETPNVGRRHMNIELALLDPDDSTIDEIYDKLVELEAYEPIMRAAWTQGTFEKSLTSPIELTALDDPPPGLEGSVMLYRGRYLHIVLDLTLDADFGGRLRVEERSDDVPVFGDARISTGYEPAPPRIHYRISEDRIMRNGDIRYFDHPRFGVIAKVARVEEPEEQIFDDTDDLLPG